MLGANQYTLFWNIKIRHFKYWKLQTLGTAIFLLFVFFNGIFYRDFSYIGVDLNGQKIFITEIVLFLLLSKITIDVLWTKRIAITKYNLKALWPLWAFFIYSLIMLGFSNFYDITFTIREFASVYYMMFFIIVIILLRKRMSFNQLVQAFLLSAIFSIVLIFFRCHTGIGWETSTEGLLRYGNYETVGLLFIISWLLIKPVGLYRAYDLIRIFILIAAISCIIFLIQHRSATIALLVSIFIMLLGRFKIRNLLIIRRKAIGAVFLLIILSFSVAVLARNELVTGTLDRLATIITPHEDLNSAWRLAVWRHTIQSMEGFDYIFGVGWGVRLPPMYFAGLMYGEEEHIGIHNSLLFYFYHTGFIGITLLLLLLGTIYTKSLIVARKTLHPEGRQVLALLATNVGILIYAMFNVVLEGPYMGSVFWITLGMLWIKTQQVKDNALQNVRHQSVIVLDNV